MSVLSEKYLGEYSQTAERLEVRVRKIGELLFQNFILVVSFCDSRDAEAQISIRNRFTDIDSLRKIWQQDAHWGEHSQRWAGASVLWAEGDEGMDKGNDKEQQENDDSHSDSEENPTSVDEQTWI